MNRLASILSALITALAVLIAPTGWANDERPVLCQGRWHVWAGPTSSPGGLGQAGAGEGEFDLEIQDCGRLAILKPFMEGIPDGQSDRVFHQEFDDWPRYRHETYAQMPVVISLRMISPRKMVGNINIADGMVTKPLRLTLLDFDPTLNDGCGDRPSRTVSPDELETEIPRTEVIDAMIRALKRQGLAPPAGSGLKLADYLHMRTDASARRGQHRDADVRGVHRVHLRLGPGGQILPREDALFDHRRSCEVNEGELIPATHFLVFKPYRHNDDTHESAAQFIEVDSGVIQRQQMASGETGVDGLSDSLLNGWRALNLPDPVLSDGRR